MDPLPGPPGAPHPGAALSVGQISEFLAGEEAAAHELNHPLDAGLGQTRRLRLIGRLLSSGCG